MTSAPLNPEEIAVAFARIADRIQKRTSCTRLEALQRACDDHPQAYVKYLAAIEAGDGPEGQDAA